MRELTGRHVVAMFGFGFGTIIAVNVTLAFNAVQSFPGLEVRNTYVASQAFDAKRAAQDALGWDVSAEVAEGHLILRFEQDGRAIAPQIVSAVFGRATSVAADQQPAFHFDAGAFTAPITAEPGNWNLRLVAMAADGTTFQQRIVVEVPK